MSAALKRVRRIEYHAAEGARIKAGDAQLLGEQIARLKNATPERLLAAAKPKASPIHHLFCWDEKAAALAWRIRQAGHYIRSITLTFTTPKASVETRAFHIVTRESGERGAVPAAEVFGTPNLAQQAIASALSELTSWRRRYAVYKQCAELSGIFRAIESVEDIPDAAE